MDFYFLNLGTVISLSHRLYFPTLDQLRTNSQLTKSPFVSSILIFEGTSQIHILERRHQNGTKHQANIPEGCCQSKQHPERWSFQQKSKVCRRQRPGTNQTEQEKVELEINGQRRII